MASVTVSIGAALAWAMNCAGNWWVMSNWPAIIAATRLESSGTILMTELLELHRALVLVHRRAPFVGVVALQHDLGARLPRFETPRPGAVGALDAVVLAQRLDAFLVVDHVGEHGELQQQFGVRLLELVFDGVGIGRAQFLDVAGAPGIRPLDRGILQPLEAVDHVLGGELLAAAERHVVAQLEGVGLAVLADRPRLGEIGNRRAAVPVERHQRVLEHVDDVGGRPPGGALRIVVRRVDATSSG